MGFFINSIRNLSPISTDLASIIKHVVVLLEFRVQIQTSVTQTQMTEILTVFNVVGNTRTDFHTIQVDISAAQMVISHQSALAEEQIEARKKSRLFDFDF